MHTVDSDLSSPRTPYHRSLWPPPWNLGEGARHAPPTFWRTEMVRAVPLALEPLQRVNTSDKWLPGRFLMDQGDRYYLNDCKNNENNKKRHDGNLSSLPVPSRRASSQPWLHAGSPAAGGVLFP
jgi:hypothetical protein